MVGNPTWLAKLAQALAAEPNLPAFTAGIDRYGVPVKSRVVAVSVAQSTLTLETALNFDGGAPGDFWLAFALPDSLGTTGFQLGAELELRELAAMADMFVDNPDIDSNAGTTDPYVLADVIASLELVANAKPASGAKVTQLYYNDPRTWTVPGLNVAYRAGHFGHFTAARKSAAAFARASDAA